MAHDNHESKESRHGKRPKAPEDLGRPGRTGRGTDPPQRRSAPEAVMDPLWYLIALLAWIALGLWAYGEIENRLDPEYGPELPDGWDTQILRVGFWWSVKGYYVGPEF